jgi:hypothetical protein
MGVFHILRPNMEIGGTVSNIAGQVRIVDVITFVK